MKRLHFTLDDETSRQLVQIARVKKWSQSGVVRVAVNSLFQRELAPLDVARAKIGRPKSKRRKS